MIDWPQYEHQRNRARRWVRGPSPHTLSEVAIGPESRSLRRWLHRAVGPLATRHFALVALVTTVVLAFPAFSRATELPSDYVCDADRDYCDTDSPWWGPDILDRIFR